MKRREAEAGGASGRPGRLPNSERASGSDSVTLTAGKGGRSHSAVPSRSVTSRVAPDPSSAFIDCFGFCGYIVVEKGRKRNYVRYDCRLWLTRKL